MIEELMSINSVKMKKELERLKPYANTHLTFEVEHKIQEYIGNLDEEEESHLIEHDKRHVIHSLDNVFLDSKNQPRFVAVKSLDKEEALVPFFYFYLPIYHLRTYSQHFARQLTQIVTGDRLVLKIPQNSCSLLFDGYGDVRVDPDGKYSEEYLLKLESYPRLSKSGCSYNDTLLGITGSLDNLLVDCTPLW